MRAPSAEPAWRPDLWGRRILMWTAYAPYLLEFAATSANIARRCCNALARGARHLDRAADSAPQGLPRVAAWAGVIAAGLLIPGGDLRAAHGEAGMARALRWRCTRMAGWRSRVPADAARAGRTAGAAARGLRSARAAAAGAIARAINKAVPALA
jgi:uncharacterized heparinase superfamily protein